MFENIEKMKIEIIDRKALGDLWFIYGNNGAKSNFNQHRFIQNILSRQEWTLDSYSGKRAEKAAKTISPKTNFNNYAISAECIEAVKLLVNFC